MHGEPTAQLVSQKVAEPLQKPPGQPTPAISTASAGHVAVPPVQFSVTSQTSINTRQTVVAAANPSESAAVARSSRPRSAASRTVAAVHPSDIGGIREKVAQRRGNCNIGAVAAARKQRELVYYGLRTHHARALHRSPRAA